MLTCPMCKQALTQIERECPRCRADLSLLADYVGQLEVNLARADDLTRAGRLGEAIWAYLTVLEVDPDQPTARDQVGQVAAAVRHFDRSSSGRRWLKKLQRQARIRAWLTSWSSAETTRRWLLRGLGVVVILAALAIGSLAGYHLGRQHAEPSPAVQDR